MNGNHGQAPARRRFLQELTTSAQALVRAPRGGPDLRLDSLRNLPETKFRQVIPTFVDGSALAYRGGHVVATLADGQSRLLFATDSDDMRLFSCFDGQRSLGEIAAQFAGSAVEETQVFERLAALFLRLVDDRICVPANPIY